MKQEHDYLQGFINQFEEEGEHQELSNDDWTVSQFLEWLKLNNYKIIKNEHNSRYPQMGCRKGLSRMDG
jgi:hypothetical protein